MLTAKDIKNLIDGLSGFFATKKDIEEVKEDIHDLRLDVLGHLDAVYKEVKDKRQEQDIHSQQHEDIRDELDIVKKNIGLHI